MNRSCCVRKIVSEPKVLLVSIRVSQRMSDWIKKEGLSNTAIFIAAVKELGYKGD